MGRKPPERKDDIASMQMFQGIHAAGGVLVVVDEACGVPSPLIDGAETLMTDERSRMVLFGNPDKPLSRFEEFCRPGSGANVIRIAWEDTPNATGEEVAPEVAEALISRKWVAERERKWGKDSPMYGSKVDARFPPESDDTLFPATAIEEAQERTLPEYPATRQVLACDIARLGGDRTVVYRNRCGVVRLLRELAQQDTMSTVGDLIALRTQAEHYSAPFVLDVGGLGIGPYDRLIEQGVSVEGFTGAERAWRPDRFTNRRAEAMWNLREALLKGEVDMDPNDDLLAAQLGSMRWRHDSQARIVIESKDDMKKRGLPSPDRADAVSMAFSRHDWRRPRDLDDPYVAARALARQVEEAIARANSPEAHQREASGAPLLTDDELLNAPL